MISYKEKVALRAEFLQEALEEERRMQRVAATSAVFLLIGIAYTILFHLVNFFLLLPNGIHFDDWSLAAVGMPGILCIVVAIFGFFDSSENSVMELTPRERELL